MKCKSYHLLILLFLFILHYTESLRSRKTRDEVQTQSSQAKGEEENTLNSNEDDPESNLFPVRVRVLEIPGEEYIQIFGRQTNASDAFGNVQPRVEFLGIPFAQAPVKNLRFQRPALKILTSDFKAIEAAPPCPQLSTNGRPIGSEDCLFMNIFMPQEETVRRNRMPVLVWFHGESLERSADGKFGILSSGSANDLLADVFVEKKIVVVTPQYRLGSLGFMSTVNEDLNGNMGNFDQLMALEWIQRFIIFFGGDPKQVTIMGHGSSAMSLGILSTSELSRGLYHRMILMGGSPLSPVAIDPTPKLTFAEIALQNSCPSFPTLRFVRCMQNRRLESLILADDRLSKGKHIGKSKMPLPIVQRTADGRFLPPLISSSPMTSISTGDFDPVPIILGVSNSEMSGFLPSIAGKAHNEIPAAIFTNQNILKQFIRAVMTRGSYDPELLADMVTFEYFAGLNISERQEQAKDLLEEMLSDFLFHVPALTFANLWSRHAPVYFYVFDYVTTNYDVGNKPDGDELDPSSRIPEAFPSASLAFHGSDLRFLMEGSKGSAEDREVSNSVVDFWINFIHKGSPLHAGVDWPQYRESSKEYLYIGSQVEAASKFRVRQELFWTQLIKEVSSRMCKMSSSSTSSSSSLPSSSGRRVKHPVLYRDIETEVMSQGYFSLGNLTSLENTDYFSSL